MTEEEERSEEKHHQEKSAPVRESGFASLKGIFILRLGDLAGPR